MSFECDACHKIATGSGLGLHLRSQGACETCGQHTVYGDCRCHGDWLKVQKERGLAR